MTILKRFILASCLWCCALPACAQVFSGPGWGLNIGLVSALGNRFQRLGVTVQGYYYRDFVQVNAEMRAYHNFKNLGPEKQYNELVTAAGVVAGYGAQSWRHNPFVSAVSNQTHYNHSVGYAYNLYFNRIGTTQQTGTFAFQLNRISVISENDIFARPTLDRFRTGAFLVQYQYKDLYQFAVNCTMWTGQMSHKVTTDKGFPYKGYMDTSKGVYTQYSHGLLSGQFKMALDDGQNLQANMGVDAEQVRNAVQNRAIHDLAFIPRKWHRSNNCHIPMLDTAGNQYLYRPDQKVKPALFYWNIFTGAGVFY